MKMSSKSVIIFLLSMQAFAASALAGNEGPAGMPLPHVPPMLLFRNSGPVVPHPHTTDVIIDVMGQMSASHGNTTVYLGSLSMDSVKTLQGKIDQLGTLDIQDRNAGAPSCVGSGPVTYTAYGKGGVDGNILLGKDMGCHAYRSYNGDAGQMINLLSGLAPLAYELLGELEQNPDADRLSSVPASGAEKALLDYTFNVGFSPEPMNGHFQILLDGTIQDHRVYMRRMDPSAPKDVLVSFGSFSPFVIAHLSLKIDALPSVEPIDLQAGQPMCMDAPFLSYHGQRSSGVNQTLGEQRGCHSIRMPEHQGDSLIKLIDGLFTLSSYR